MTVEDASNIDVAKSVFAKHYEVDLSGMKCHLFIILYYYDVQILLDHSDIDLWPLTTKMNCSQFILES